MQRTGAWILLGSLVALLVTGCARGGEEPLDVTVDVTVEPSPPQLGPVTVIIYLYDDNDQPLSGAAIELEGNMNHPGMVPTLANAAEVAPGRYQAILIQADLPDGRSMEHRVDLPGVADTGGNMSIP